MFSEKSSNNSNELLPIARSEGRITKSQVATLTAVLPLFSAKPLEVRKKDLDSVKKSQLSKERYTRNEDDYYTYDFSTMNEESRKLAKNLRLVEIRLDENTNITIDIGLAQKLKGKSIQELQEIFNNSLDRGGKALDSRYDPNSKDPYNNSILERQIIKAGNTELNKTFAELTDSPGLEVIIKDAAAGFDPTNGVTQLMYNRIMQNAVQNLNIPNLAVVNTYACMSTGDKDYLYMEKVQGHSLEDYYRKTVPMIPKEEMISHLNIILEKMQDILPTLEEKRTDLQTEFKKILNSDLSDEEIEDKTFHLSNERKTITTEHRYCSELISQIKTQLILGLSDFHSLNCINNGIGVILRSESSLNDKLIKDVDRRGVHGPTVLPKYLSPNIMYNEVTKQFILIDITLIEM